MAKEQISVNRQIQRWQRAERETRMRKSKAHFAQEAITGRIPYLADLSKGDLFVVLQFGDGSVLGIAKTASCAYTAKDVAATHTIQQLLYLSTLRKGDVRKIKAAARNALRKLKQP